MFKHSIQVAFTVGSALAVVLWSITNVAPSSASTSAYQKNVDQMTTVLRTKPNDEAAHYYRAVSLQYMGEYQRAKSDYEWVVSNGRNPTFRTQANLGLQGIMKTLYGVGMGSAKTGGTASTTVAQAPVKQTTTKIASAAVGGGKPKMYEFYTSWCHVCNAHASEYEELQGEVSSKVDFQRLNAEDPANSDLVTKYSVHAYPTFVMVDGGGKAVFNEAGGYDKSSLKDIMGERLGVKL